MPEKNTCHYCGHQIEEGKGLVVLVPKRNGRREKIHICDWREMLAFSIFMVIGQYEAIKMTLADSYTEYIY